MIWLGLESLDYKEKGEVVVLLSKNVKKNLCKKQSQILCNQ